MNKIKRLLFMIFCFSLSISTYAAPIIIQPDDSIDGKDMWANPSFGGVGDDDTLHVWNSAVVVGFKSIIQFPLTAIPQNRMGAIHSVSLNLYALDNEDPSPNSHAPGFDGQSVDIDLGVQANAWTEVTANGNTPEATAAWNAIQQTGNTIDSVQVNAVNQWIQFDVTGTVQNWLNNNMENYGFILSSPTEVRASDGQVIAAAFASSSWGDPTLRPYLEVIFVPTPTIIWLFIAGLFALYRCNLKQNQP